MKRNRIVPGTAAIAATALVIGVAASIGLGGPPTPTLSDGSLAALQRPVRVSDALPARVLELPFARHFANPTAARLAFRDDERAVYVVPGRESSLCLVVIESDSVSLNCAGRSVLRSGAVWQGTGNEDGSTNIVGVAGDGIAYARADGARRVVVKDNVFSIDSVTGRTIVFGTTEGAEAEFDLR